MSWSKSKVSGNFIAWPVFVLRDEDRFPNDAVNRKADGEPALGSEACMPRTNLNPFAVLVRYSSARLNFATGA